MENRHVIMHPTYGYVSKDYTYAGPNLQDAELFSDEDLLVILGVLSGGLAAQEMVIMSATEAQALSQSQMMIKDGLEYMQGFKPEQYMETIKPELEKGIEYMQDLRPELEKGIETIKPELEGGIEYMQDLRPELEKGIETIRPELERGMEYIQDLIPEQYIDSFVDGIHELEKYNQMHEIFQQQ